MARAGAEATPPVPPPAPLRPFLSFRRLSGRALERARRVLDDDEGFRQRVRDAVGPEDVGEAGWLLLDRPDGWQERLAELLDGAVRQADEVGAAEQVGRLSRELARVTEERDDAVAVARKELDDGARSRKELDEERTARQALEGELDALREQLAQARQERADAVRDLKALEARAAARLDELKRAHADLAAARREVEALQGGDDASDTALPLPDTQVPTAAPGGGGPSDGAGVSASDVDRAVLARLVGRAAQAAALLSSALAEAAELVEPPAAEPVPDLPTGEPGDPGDPGDAAARAATARAAAPMARRQPVALPVGAFDDTPEAALHLLRHPGMTLAVDGYNVSLAGWPTLALSAQRRRLVDALEVLAARTGCAAVVVFDGADVGAGLPGESRPRGVQVRFTAPDVEADDELLALLDALPAERPVTLASSDRRVVDGARRRGANVVSATQLLAVLDH